MELGRSCLYNIEPMGLNSPFVESLTSYINRLAEAHLLNTGTLFNEIYVPMLNKNYLSSIAARGGNGFIGDSYRINGFGEYALKMKDATEALTGRTDLLFMTLLLWKEVLPERGLLRKKRAWCSLCYEEMKQESKAVYDPLICLEYIGL